MLAICREGGFLRNPLCSYALLALEQIPPSPSHRGKGLTLELSF